jgi:arabinofuranosyltransferase
MLYQNKLSSRVFDIAVVIIWSLALTLFTYIANGKKIGIDDADIFFTYASNLADGKGLIYSPGIPKVEGYTSTLWMLVSFFVFKSGLSENSVWILSLVLFALSTLIAFRILEMSLHRNWWIQAKILYLVIISLSFGYSSWMLLTLMDTTLWGFLLMAVIYFLISPLNNTKNLTLGSLVFFLVPLSRPESIILIPLILF